jgi:hypothetical protein
MDEKLAHAIRQAVDARRRADACTDSNTRNEWLRVAGMWDELARNYEEFQNVRDSLDTVGGKTRQLRPRA